MPEAGGAPRAAGAAGVGERPDGVAGGGRADPRAVLHGGEIPAPILGTSPPCPSYTA